MLTLIAQLLGRGLAFNPHGGVTGHQQKRAEGDRLAVAQVPVGQIPAQKRQQIDERGVGAVLRAGEAVVKQEMLGEIEDQQAAHPVIGKPLPHLREEENMQALGMLAHLQKDRNGGGDRDHDPRQNNDIHVLRSSPSRPDAPHAPVNTGP